MFQDSQALKYQNQMVIRKDILNSGKEKVVTVINLQEVGLSGKDLQKKMWTTETKGNIELPMSTKVVDLTTIILMVLGMMK